MHFLQSPLTPRLCVFQVRASAHGFTSGWHEHDFFELGFVLEGQTTWHIRGKKSQTLSEGHCLLLPPGSSHQEQGAPPVRLGWIGFDTEPGMPKKFLERPVDLGTSTFDAFYLLRRIYEEQHNPQPGSAEICALASQQLLILFERAALSPPRVASPPPRARQIQVARSLAAYLDQNISQPLSLEQIAEYHHLSAAHLSVLFQRCYHTTPTAYRMQKRIAHAQALLNESSQSIKEIATACGFTDAAHFCKEFKKRTGHTPGGMRHAIA